MLPQEGFKYYEILVICKGISNGEIYSHAGAFVRREITSRNRLGFKVEVSYYDSNQNEIFSIGGHTLGQRTMDWDLFKDYEVVKFYALAARTLDDSTFEKKKLIYLEHAKMARNFLRHPEDAQWEKYVHLL